jgi:hypothetical protein
MARTHHVKVTPVQREDGCHIQAFGKGHDDSIHEVKRGISILTDELGCAQEVYRLRVNQL